MLQILKMEKYLMQILNIEKYCNLIDQNLILSET